MRDGLLPALRSDPDVFRAFLRGFNLLEAPEALMRDPLVLARVMAAYQERDSRPPEPPLGPTREELLLGGWLTGLGQADGQAVSRPRPQG